MNAVWVPVAACLTGVAVAASAISLGAQVSGGLILMSLAFVGLVTLIVKRCARRGEAFSALVGVAVYSMVAFPIGALFVRNLDEVEGAYSYASLKFSVGTAFLGLLFLWAGYEWTARLVKGPAAAAMGETFALRRLTAARLVVLYCVGWAARAVLFETGNYSRLTQAEATSLGAAGFFVTLLALLPQFVVLYQLVDPQRNARVPGVGGLILAEIAWALSSAARANFVSLAIGITVALYLRGNRLPIKTLAISILATVFVVFPVLSTYRTAEAGSTSAQQQALASISADRDFLQQGYENALSRASTVVSSAAWFDSGRPEIIDYPPRRILDLIIVDLIPRAIYPDKPNSFLFGNSFGRSVGLLGSRDGYTSITVSPTLQGWMVGGLLGIAILMPAVGAVLALFDTATFRRDIPIVGATFAVLAFRAYYTQESIVSAGTYGLIKSTVFLLLVLWVVSLKRPDYGGASPGKARASLGRGLP